jgi:carboxypeptidase family protein
MTAGRLFILSSCGLLLFPSLAGAQERSAFVYGRLIDDATRGPIVAGSVSLVTQEGRSAASVLTDSLGRFRLAVAQAGKYRLKGERIGYKTGESPLFSLAVGEALPMDFWLSTRAVLLAPLEVKVTIREWFDRGKSVAMAQFFDRMKLYSALGGVFLTSEKVRNWDGSTLSAMLAATAGAHLNGQGGVMLRQGCTPTIYVNGQQFRLVPGEQLDQLFRPSDLEAVEVYKGAATLPGELGGTQGECAVVLWTRRT